MATGFSSFSSSSSGAGSSVPRSVLESSSQSAGGPGGLGTAKGGYLLSLGGFAVLAFFGGGGSSGLRAVSARGVATCINTSIFSFSLTWRKLGDWREGCVCTLRSVNVVACPCGGILAARAARSFNLCMSSAASNWRSSVQPSSPEGVRTRKNRRLRWRRASRSPCFTVATTRDCRAMSLRILRTAGPTYASPIDGACCEPPWHEPRTSARTAARLTLVMKPESTPNNQFTSRPGTRSH